MGTLVPVVWCTVAHACQIVAWLGGIRSCACALFVIVFTLVINLGITSMLETETCMLLKSATVGSKFQILVNTSHVHH